MPPLLVLILTALILLVVIFTAMLVRGARRPPRRTLSYALAHGLPADPGELGFAFEEWTLDRPDGAGLAVWEIETSGAGGAGGAHDLTAVFIHGWGQSKLGGLGRIQPWDRWCRRLVLYDLRGHGESTGLSRLGDREDDDLLALLDRLGEGRFLLIANSMGAGIAIRAAAADHPATERIAGIVAFAPYRDFHTALRARLRGEGLPARPLTDLAMAWFRLRGMRHTDPLPAAANLRCPLLIIHGTEDDVSPMGDAEDLIAAAPEAQLVRIEGATHMNLAEEWREQAEHDAAAFITRAAQRSLTVAAKQ